MDVNNKATINTHPAIAITVPMLPLHNCGKTAAGMAALPFNALPYMNNSPFIKYHNHFNAIFFFFQGTNLQLKCNTK